MICSEVVQSGAKLLALSMCSQVLESHVLKRLLTLLMLLTQVGLGKASKVPAFQKQACNHGEAMQGNRILPEQVHKRGFEPALAVCMHRHLRGQQEGQEV